MCTICNSLHRSVHLRTVTEQGEDKWCTEIEVHEAYNNIQPYNQQVEAARDKFTESWRGGEKFSYIANKNTLFIAA